MGQPNNGAILILILIFYTLSGLAVHYFSLLQQGMAATLG
jgi:hypothetical protein